MIGFVGAKETHLRQAIVTLSGLPHDVAGPHALPSARTMLHSRHRFGAGVATAGAAALPITRTITMR